MELTALPQMPHLDLLDHITIGEREDGKERREKGKARKRCVKSIWKQ